MTPCNLILTDSEHTLFDGHLAVYSGHPQKLQQPDACVDATKKELLNLPARQSRQTASMIHTTPLHSLHLTKPGILYTRPTAHANTGVVARQGSLLKQVSFLLPSQQSDVNSQPPLLS